MTDEANKNSDVSENQDPPPLLPFDPEKIWAKVQYIWARFKENAILFWAGILVLVLATVYYFVSASLEGPPRIEFPGNLRIVSVAFTGSSSDKNIAKQEAGISAVVAQEVESLLGKTSEFLQCQPTLYHKKKWFKRSAVNPLEIKIDTSSDLNSDARNENNLLLLGTYKELRRRKGKIDLAFYFKTEFLEKKETGGNSLKISIRILRALDPNEKEDDLSGMERSLKTKVEKTDLLIEGDSANIDALVADTVSAIHKYIANTYEGSSFENNETETSFALFEKSIPGLKEELKNDLKEFEGENRDDTKSTVSLNIEKTLSVIEKLKKDGWDLPLKGGRLGVEELWINRLEASLESYRFKVKWLEEHQKNLEEFIIGLERLAIGPASRNALSTSRLFLKDLKDRRNQNIRDFYSIEKLYLETFLTLDLVWSEPGQSALVKYGEHLLKGNILDSSDFNIQKKLLAEILLDEGYSESFLRAQEKKMLPEEKDWELRYGKTFKTAEEKFKIVVKRIDVMSNELKEVNKELGNQTSSSRNPEKLLERIKELERLLETYETERGILKVKKIIEKGQVNLNDARLEWQMRHNAQFQFKTIEKEFQAMKELLVVSEKKLKREAPLVAIPEKRKKALRQSIKKLKWKLFRKEEGLYRHQKKYAPKEALKRLDLLINKCKEGMEKALKARSAKLLRKWFQTRNRFSEEQFQFYVFFRPKDTPLFVEKALKAASNEIIFIKESVKRCWVSKKEEERHVKKYTEGYSFSDAEEGKVLDYLIKTRLGNNLDVFIEDEVSIPIRLEVYRRQVNPWKEKRSGGTYKGEWVSPGNWIAVEYNSWVKRETDWTNSKSVLFRQLSARKRYWKYNNFNDSKRQRDIFNTLLKEEASRVEIFDKKYPEKELSYLSENGELKKLTYRDRPVHLRISGKCEFQPLVSLLGSLQETKPSLSKIIFSLGTGRSQGFVKDALRPRESILLEPNIKMLSSDLGGRLKKYLKKDAARSYLLFTVLCLAKDPTNMLEYRFVVSDGSVKKDIEYKGKLGLDNLKKDVELRFSGKSKIPTALIYVDPICRYNNVLFLMEALQDIGVTHIRFVQPIKDLKVKRYNTDTQ